MTHLLGLDSPSSVVCTAAWTNCRSVVGKEAEPSRCGGSTAAPPVAPPGPSLPSPDTIAIVRDRHTPGWTLWPLNPWAWPQLSRPQNSTSHCRPRDWLPLSKVITGRRSAREQLNVHPEAQGFPRAWRSRAAPVSSTIPRVTMNWHQKCQSCHSPTAHCGEGQGGGHGHRPPAGGQAGGTIGERPGG